MLYKKKSTIFDSELMLMLTNSKIGGFFPIDESANILNPTNFDLIKPSLLPILSEIIQIYKENEGENLHSIWLRGSIPRGLYTEEYSDIDVFALVKIPNIRWQKAKWSDKADSIIPPDLYWCATAFGRHCEEGKKSIFELLKAYEIKNRDIFSLKENIGKVIILLT